MRPILPLLLLFSLLATSSLLMAVDEDNPNADTINTNSADNAAANSDDDAMPTEAQSTDVAPAEPITRAPPNPAKRRMDEVLNYLGLFQREQEVIKFSDSEDSVSGLYLPENTGSPQGGILILHDVEHHAHWPYTTGPLRQYLPDYGWNTLSLFFGNHLIEPLPMVPAEGNQELQDDAQTADQDIAPDLASQALEQNAQAIPADTESPPADEPVDQNFADNSDGNTGALDSLDNIAQNFDGEFNLPAENTEEAPADSDPQQTFINGMRERVEGGLRQLNTLGQFNLVIVAHGLSANWAVETLSSRFEKNPGAKGYALILVNPKSSRYPSYDLNDRLALLNIPILDIYTQYSDEQERLAKMRRGTMARKQNHQYQQIRLPAIATSHQGNQTMITRRVRGWLKTNAAGEEVNVKIRGG